MRAIMLGSHGRAGAWTTAIVAACVTSCAAAAATTTPATIAPLHGTTTIASYGGVAAWSDYDAGSRSWHVVVRRDGRISTPPIRAASKAIDVDVGPGPSGSPTLAYVDCASGCRVVVANVDGSLPRAVPGSAGASHVTTWGDRVAWAVGARVIASGLNGGGRRTLGGAPRRECYRPPSSRRRSVCETPLDRSVKALQLHGAQLALIDSFALREGGSEGTSEVRTEAITGGPQRLVARMHIGTEGAESWLGPSWLGRKLYFYMQSLGTGTAVYGFDPARGTYARARAFAWLSGFSMVGARQAIEATGPGAGAECGEAGTAPCVVRLSERFAFKASKRPVTAAGEARLDTRSASAREERRDP